jgi:arylsulfatase A-like enzyme
MSVRYLLTLLAVLGSVVLLIARAWPKAQEPESEGMLLVYVVVDQLRADLLDRYDGGFARLRAEGHRWENATFDHAQTSTSPGHGTAATGTHPHRHGLVGNNWLEQVEDGSWQSVHALRDLGTRIVGQPGLEPGATAERVSVVDLAPTLAQLLGVPFPGDLDGRPVVRR